MARQITNYQCPSCTGPLHYGDKSGMLECDYCGSRYTVQEIEALYREKDEAAATTPIMTSIMPEMMQSTLADSAGSAIKSIPMSSRLRSLWQRRGIFRINTYETVKIYSHDQG